MVVKQIKIFGERNTGTNYITDMIRQNFTVRILSDGPPYWWEKHFGLSGLSMNSYFMLTSWRNLGWKHAAPKLSESQTQNRYFIAITKNPYSWLISLHKRPYHNWKACDLSFSDFLRTPWPLMHCDGVNEKSVTPIELWNIKNQSYLKLADIAEASLLASYEEILEDPSEFLHKLSLLIDDPLKDKIKLQDKGSKLSDKHKTYNQYRDYYLNELWRSKLTNEDISYINNSLDAKLVRKLGYSLI